MLLNIQHQNCYCPVWFTEHTNIYMHVKQGLLLSGKNTNNNMGYWKSSIVWAITQCRSLKVDRRFGGTCHLPLQSRGIS
jgi:hypothetical protein